MNIVGKDLIRKDGIDKVKGKAVFAGDIYVPNMLYAKLKLSPHPRAEIIDINIDKALKMPGVKAVLTAKNIPGTNIVPLVINDQPFLAEKQVNFHGQPVAVVAAEKLYQAENAVKAIEVKYKILEPLCDLEENIKENAKKVCENGNIHKSYVLEKGNIDEYFNNADLIIENTYKTPYQEHAYLETQSMIAIPSEEKTFQIYGSMQCPFYVLNAVSAILGRSKSSIRVAQAVTGGGFGGKEDVPSLIAGYASLCAYYTDLPVKLILTREEDVLIMSKRHPGLIKYRSAFNKNGELLAVDVKYYLDGGAYATLSPIVLWRGLIHAVGPYRCKAAKVYAAAIATNLVPCGAYRGFGTPQILFAHESQMDIAAEKLNISTDDIRMINLIETGDISATDQKITESCGMKKTLQIAKEKSNWDKKIKQFEIENKENEFIKKGIGVSTVYYGVGLGAGGKFYAKAGAFIQINADGSLQIAVGTAEMGQGMRAVLSQIGAEAIGVDYDMISFLPVDTSRVPDSGPTVASRATFMSGNAIIKACEDLKERISPIACEMMKINENEILEYKNGKITSLKTKNSISFNDVINECFQRKLNLSTTSYYQAPNTSFDEKTGLGDAYFVYSYATNIAEVEVDIRTAQVEVKEFVSALDVGKAINPLQVEGQIQGGNLQGIGYALSEEILHNKGIMLNNSFSTYIIPGIMDTPKLIPCIIEDRYSEGPYGAKGFGELPLMGVAPAIANAVFNATKIRLKEIPITPERLFDAISKEEK